MSNITSTAKKKTKKGNTAFDKLVGPTDPAADREARDRMITARIGLLMRHPFFGNLATRLVLVNADEWLSTAATDGYKLYYNSRFVNMLDTKEVEFLFAHEILHVVYSHLGRLDHRDPQIWNIACDYAVNADLKRHKVGKFITTVPCLYESKYDGMMAEAIYDDLIKNAKKIDMDSLLDQMIDEHMDGDGSGDGDEEKDGKGKGAQRPGQLTQEQRDQLKQDMKEAIINASQSAEPGTLPAGVERMIRELTDPVMPWREVLQSQLTSMIKSDYSWLRPSRKGWHMDAVLPGPMPGEEIDVFVMIDMSGSISQKEGGLFISEVAGMMDMFDGYKIKVASFDTKVYNMQEFNSDNMDSVDDYKLMGGGGTDFNCIFDFLKEECIEPQRLIVFTDGYGGNWGAENYCETIWVIKDSGLTAEWGTTLAYDG